MSKTPSDFFTEEHAKRYDERNQKLSPISENLHFLISLILTDLPAKAKVLSVGAGTGTEILSLAKIFPDWSFVAVEPSLSMLNVCRQRMKDEGFTDRCEFVHGYAKDVDAPADFDVALSLLVAHFIKRDERINFFKEMTKRLRVGGYLVNAEISFDLDAQDFLFMYKNWESVQKLMGATPESLNSLSKQLREALTVLPPAETESMIRQSGIAVPVKFFQAFMISAWYGIKQD